MTTPEWLAVLGDEDRAVYEACGQGGRRGLGERLALAVVDVQRNFLGIDGPTVESVRTYPTSTGAPGWRAIERVQELLAAFRSAGLPVFFTQSRTLPQERQYDSFLKKKQPEARARIERLPDDAFEIADPVKPLPTEVVMRKCFASAFAGTPFASFLTGAGVDTIVVCGLTTSGCVRATVVDAVAYNFNVAVVADACADRLRLSHRVSLLDLHMKYGDVMTTAEVLAVVRERAALGR